MKEENFETKMKELENIAKDLEKGDLSLEDSVKKFEKGIKISKECNKLLEDAEKRITILLNNDGDMEEKDFTIKEEGE